MPFTRNFTIVLFVWLFKRALLKMPANWSLDITNGVYHNCAVTCCLTKLQSTSLSFVVSWSISFEVNYKLLSQCCCSINCFSHSSPRVVWAIALCSTSTLDWAATSYFLVLQLTTLPPTMSPCLVNHLCKSSFYEQLQDATYERQCIY